MKILKTYARAFVEDMDTALPLYEALVGAPAHIRIRFEAADIVGVGDFLIVAGPPDAIDGYRGTIGPIIVENLDVAEATLVGLGCVPGPRIPAPTGELLYAVHPDGVSAEYLQFIPELFEKVIVSTGDKVASHP